MKSNKQKRNELKAKRAAQAKRECAKRAVARRAEMERLAATGVAVNPSKLAPDNSHSTPAFVARGYYVDVPFTCQGCGVDEIWTARQQKWWYECAKGNIWTTARMCRACRRRERLRRNEARRIHMEGLARKRASRGV